MPIYEYACMDCEAHFDELVRTERQVVLCPQCNKGNVLKQMSSFAVAGARSAPSFGNSTGGGGGCCGGGCGCG